MNNCVGLNIVEVAHDMHHPVARYVKQELKLLNSFDTWHGMNKNFNHVCVQCVPLCLLNRDKECGETACQSYSG